jgi:diacylglycerol kinase family enzyme
MLIIYNPVANNFRLGKDWHKILPKLELLKHDYQIIQTEYPGHAREIAKEVALSKEHDIVLSAGGDGTTNEMVMGFYDSGIANEDFPIIGSLPVGSANDFCLTHDIPFDLEEAIGVINQENVAIINSVKCTADNQVERYSINHGQFGLLSVLSHAATVLREKPIFPFNFPPFSYFSKGTTRFTLIGLKYIIWKYSNIPGTITLDNDEPRDIKLTALAFGVGNTMAHYPFMPHADPYGETFALCLGENLSRIKQLGLVSAIKKGNYKNLELLDAKKVILEVEKPLPGDTDGELLIDQGTRFEMELQKKNLKVIVP